MKKSIRTLLVTAIFFIIFAMLCISASADSPITSFTVSTGVGETAAEFASVEWFASDNGKYYIFLPSTADRSNLTVNFDASAEITCGKTTLENGMTTDIFEQGESFILKCDGTKYTVIVVQAENEGTIYVNTKSGNMDAVHADKEHKEPGDILIVDKNGEVEYSGELDYIKGRGNSTWNHDKKPYNIKLESKADLFGMGKHKSWCLLANATDAAIIRNYLAYNLALQFGVPYTSETHFVNVYLNGKYAGLYMICEKVDIGENRVDIYDLEGETEDVNDKDLDEYKLAGKQNSRDFGSVKYADIPNNPDEITGGYLLELEKIYRYVNEASGFITNIGQAVVVKTPEYATKKQVEYISKYYQSFEDALYSGTGYNSEGKHYSEYIDVDSLARMYIMYEFTANFDGCSSSFYLSKDVGGKLVAGPLWDFDLSLGTAMPNDLINHVQNVAQTDLLYIQTCFIGNHAEAKKALLAQAFSHNDFQELVEKIWNEEFMPLYLQFDESIEIVRDEIQQSFIMNAITWKTVGSTKPASVTEKQINHTETIRNYAKERFAFLSNVFNDDTFFVKYDIGKYGKALIHDTTVYNADETAVVLKKPSTDRKDVVFLGWSTSPDGTGELYNPGDKITVTDNVNLYAKWIKKTAANSKLQAMIDRINEIFGKFAELIKKVFG